MSVPIRVVLADDHRVVREGVRDRLAAQPDIDVVGEAADGVSALEMIRSARPDVVVLDVEMPGLTGVEVAQAVRDEALGARVLVLSGYDDAEYVGALLDAGASGYLTKDESLSQIVAAVRGVAAGEDGWLSRKHREPRAEPAPRPARGDAGRPHAARNRRAATRRAGPHQRRDGARAVRLRPHGPQPPGQRLRQAGREQPRRGDRVGVADGPRRRVEPGV